MLPQDIFASEFGYGRDSKMKRRAFGYGVLAAVLVAALGLVLGSLAAAQKPAEGKAACVGCSVDGKTTPRTADGHPDFSGFWNNPDPLGHISNRSDDGSVLFDFAGELTADEFTRRGDSPQQANQPPYKPEYMEKVKAIAATEYGGSTSLDPQFDCKPSGIPRGGFGTMQIVQSAQVIAILFENGENDRIIYLDGRPHPKDLDTSYMGDSIGHWEGDTLVVDVAGLNDETWLGGSLNGSLKSTSIHSDKEHVVERWTRNGDVMTYEATVEDPVMFTKPWVINPRHIRHATADDYLLQYHCITEDKTHIVKPTDNDKFQCLYCLPGH
jgi:hypothetical protein